MQGGHCRCRQTLAQETQHKGTTAILDTPLKHRSYRSDMNDGQRLFWGEGVKKWRSISTQYGHRAKLGISTFYFNEWSCKPTNAWTRKRAVWKLERSRSFNANINTIVTTEQRDSLYNDALCAFTISLRKHWAVLFMELKPFTRQW